MTQQGRRAAFTLVELLVVIGIIALIISGSLSVASVVRENSLRKETEAILSASAAQLEAIYNKTGSYPTEFEARDAWDRPIQYTPSEDGYSLISLGADGVISDDDLKYEL